jgi:putative transposase
VAVGRSLSRVSVPDIETRPLKPGPLFALPGVVPRFPRSRLVAQGTLHHCFWRSHNRSAVFDSDEARRKFLGLLAKYKDRHGIEVLSYCLMSTHPHVVCRASRGQPPFSAFWKVVNQCFARWSNRRTGGRGQVVMERLGSPRVKDGGRHELEVMLYGDMNPVRAGIVVNPRDWPWSSHGHYALGLPDPLVTDSPAYLSLGGTPLARRVAYVRLLGLRFARRVLRHRPDFVRRPFVGPALWIATAMAELEGLPDG